MAAELPRPGVEIIQEFRTVSPTVLTPTLMSCIVGVGKQIVELTKSDGSGGTILNSEAIVTLPGSFISKAATGTPPVYGGLNGKALVVSINNGPSVTTTFVDTGGAGLTPASVVDQIQTAFTTAGVTAARPELVGDGTTQWLLRTIGTGEFQFIDIKLTTDDVVLSSFGIGKGKRYSGIGYYNELIVQIPQIAFPDPRGNLDELAIESDSVRVFVGVGNGGFRESLRDSAFCVNGEVDDAAVTTEGTVDLVAAFPVITTETLTLKVDGGALQTVVFATPANATALLAAINAQTTGLIASLGTGTPNGLVMTSDSKGASASIQIVGGTSLGLLGIGAETVEGVSIQTVDDGNGDAVTPLFKFTGEDFTTTPAAVVVTGSGGTYPLAADVTLMLNDGNQEQSIVLAAALPLTAVLPADSVVKRINDVMGTSHGGYITASDSGGELRLTHYLTGTDSVITLSGTAAALTALGLVAGTYRPPDNAIPGGMSKPEAGDELWIDGVLIGAISEVAPGGEADRLKIGIQQPISLDAGMNFYIVAKNLPGVAGRPSPDLVVDGNGDAWVKQEQLRDTKGDVVSAGGSIYVTYTAVRKDVTALADNPGLLRFDDVTSLEESLSPINSSNPLGLGLYFALLNSPGTQVTGLGVDSISDDSPYGTVEAFTRAAEYLEAFEVYAMAPMTHDESVHQVFSTHVTAMSEPAAKGERVAIVNPSIPTHRQDTLVASGTDGDTIGSTGLMFDSKVANLTALVQAAGINPVGTIPTSAGLYMDVASDSKKYSIKSISGSQVTIRVTFAPGENDDSYYSTTKLNDPPLPSALVSEAFSVKVRGAALTVAGITDKDGIAETIAAIGSSYGNRRLWMLVPDRCGATLEGSEQLIEGFYMPAAIAGMVGQNPPQQSFTNFPISGLTRVVGSNDTFNERQMNVMAGGGAWVVIQEVAGAPLISRMALTTDLTSIETRTDSITKVVDYTAKFLRRSLKTFIGRFNITQGFLDSLGSVVQGVLGLLVETGVLIGANLNNIIQDEDAPDTVLIDITLDVPYPCNYVRLTLVI